MQHLVQAVRAVRLLLYFLITFYCPLYKLLAFAVPHVEERAGGEEETAKSILLRFTFCFCFVFIWYAACVQICAEQINTKEIY